MTAVTARNSLFQSWYTLIGAPKGADISASNTRRQLGAGITAFTARKSLFQGWYTIGRRKSLTQPREKLA